MNSNALEARKFYDVYVKNFEADVDEKLRQLFLPFGDIVSCKVMCNDNDTSKKFGFVSFANHKAARKAVEHLNNSEYEGHRIFINRAQKNDERQNELKEQFHQMNQLKQNCNKKLNLYFWNLSDG